MKPHNAYYHEVKLVVQLIAFVDAEACFALCGGSAINLFVSDFPRLAVNIDLAYLPIKSRDEALIDIRQAFDRMSRRIIANLPGASTQKAYEANADSLGLVVSRAGVKVRIRLAPVLRAVVYPTQRRRVVGAVEEEFGFAEIAVLSLADLYAGKICAALDRQHPRDLFDIKLMLDNGGLDEATRKVFIVYLISHARPIVELLAPHFHPIGVLFATEFKDLTSIDISVLELEASRMQIIQLVNKSLTDQERQFLLSFQHGHADWSLLGLDDAAELPAVKWKLQNLKTMDEERQRADTQRLSMVLSEL